MSKRKLSSTGQAAALRRSGCNLPAVTIEDPDPELELPATDAFLRELVRVEPDRERAVAVRQDATEIVATVLPKLPSCAKKRSV